MPSVELLDAIAARQREDAEAADRQRFRDLMISSIVCLGWGALGLFGVLWSFHTTDVTYGKMAFFGGLGVGNGGVIFTILGVYRRGEERGDW